MRLVSALLFVALTGSAVLADEAKPADPKPEVTKKHVPLRVVKVLPETRQVLLFDKTHGNHVVAEVGQNVDGYIVDDIDDDEVTLSNADTGLQVLLAAPAAHRERAAERSAAKKAAKAPEDPYSEGDKPAAEPKVETPVDPYAAADTTAPVDPYAPVVTAPSVTVSGPGVTSIDAGTDPGIAAFADAVSPPPRSVSMNDAKPTPAKAPAKTTAKGKGKAKPTKAEPATDSGALAAAATGSPNAAVIARTDVDAALADFGKLAGSFRATFTAEGLRFDAITDGTLLAQAGLKKGDVVTAVDNQPLRSLDDAANLYARAGSVKSTTIQLVRAGKPLTLKVAIQ